MPTTPNNLTIVTDLPPLPVRPTDSHKGMYGRILAIGGSAAMPGSIALVANAAYRAGAGLVRIFCPAGAQPTAIALAPCATSVPAAETSAGRFSLAARPQLLAQAAEHDVLAMGPGMGASPAGAQLVKAALSTGRPTVLDADGLNNLAALDRFDRATAPLILTPHPGEMKRLLEALNLGVTLSHDPSARQAAAVALARRLGCVALLKGDRTVVTDGSRLYINDTGNPGMATGGTGDVLTGLVAALLGQNFDPFEAAALGSYLHGLAGDIAADRFGHYSLMATDLLDTLPEAFRQFAKERRS